MIRLLASVKDADEAETALLGGADIIDFKDPARGALGALPAGLIASGVRRVARRAPTSATTGDWPLDSAALTDAAERIAAAGRRLLEAGTAARRSAAELYRGSRAARRSPPGSSGVLRRSRRPASGVGRLARRRLHGRDDRHVRQGCGQPARAPRRRLAASFHRDGSRSGTDDRARRLPAGGGHRAACRPGPGPARISRCPLPTRRTRRAAFRRERACGAQGPGCSVQPPLTRASSVASSSLSVIRYTSTVLIASPTPAFESRHLQARCSRPRPLRAGRRHPWSRSS